MTKLKSSFRILGVASQGSGGDDEARLKQLLEPFCAEIFSFDRKTKLGSGYGLFSRIWNARPDIVVLEGTGVAAGMALILGRLWLKVPYIVSSGDAVGPFVGAQHWWLGPVFSFYERVLTRLSAGFIGWTPYLSGRALGFGAPRVMTAPGWAPAALSEESIAAYRRDVRRELGIPEDALVIGLVGSLAWNKRVGYCYGFELVQALLKTKRHDIRVLIIGDGAGKAELERMASQKLGKTILLTGRVQRERVPVYLACMDLASLPQSVDQVGAYRYSTKLSEYMASYLPIVTGEIPLAYDLPGNWMWRLPGDTPWSEQYINSLASLLDNLKRGELEEKRKAVPRSFAPFEKNFQVERVGEFVREAYHSWRIRQGLGV